MNSFADEIVSEESQPVHPIPDTTLPGNLYRADRALQRHLRRYFRNKQVEYAWAEDYLAEWGGICAQKVEPLIGEADRNPPTLKQFNRRGERVDELIYHPAYHE